MLQDIFTIGRFTFFEAMRSRLFIMLVVGVICLLGLTVFVGEIAITESKQTQVLLFASILRVFIVCTVALFVITSISREFNDKGFELILSLPLTRTSYYLGKFSGFIVFALVMLVLPCAMLLLFSSFSSVMFWSLSLLCEQIIVIAMSLLCVFTFSNVTIAFTSVISFYLLSRTMYAIQLISESPILEYKTASQEFINQLVDVLAFVLPEINIFTKSEWLIYDFDMSLMFPIFVQTSIYFVILFAAGLFDLYRKDL